MSNPVNIVGVSRLDNSVVGLLQDDLGRLLIRVGEEILLLRRTDGGQNLGTQ
jgi:hypothetical protein